VVGRGSGLKIGHSKRPAGRMSEMQVGSPVDLWMAHTWRLSSDGAKLLERTLHDAFAWCARRGEWFDILAPEVIAVGELFLAGRNVAAMNLSALCQEKRVLEAQWHSLKRAWYVAPVAERREAEAQAARLLPMTERRMAANTLAALDLGLWTGNGPHTLAGRNAIKRLREQALG
jgi:hypothetical protein